MKNRNEFKWKEVIYVRFKIKRRMQLLYIKILTKKSIVFGRGEIGSFCTQHFRFYTLITPYNHFTYSFAALFFRHIRFYRFFIQSHYFHSSKEKLVFCKIRVNESKMQQYLGKIITSRTMKSSNYLLLDLIRIPN